MNKGVLYFFIVLALILIGYNTTVLDFNDPFRGDSFVAIASILAAACAIVLLLILNASKQIEKKSKE